MVNFNFSNSKNYDVNTSLIDEVIGLYGVNIKYLIVTKINNDDLVFGDYSHLKTDNTKVFDIVMLPETTEDWDSTASSFDSFGLTNYENITLFVATQRMVEGTITGNLIVLPNNKIMEVTNVSYEVPGINNLFTENDTKSVIKLVCKPFDNKLIQEIAPEVVGNVDIPYNTLDTYFQELTDITNAQDVEAEITPDKVTNKVIVDKSEDDVWGAFK